MPSYYPNWYIYIRICAYHKIHSTYITLVCICLSLSLALPIFFGRLLFSCLLFLSLSRSFLHWFLSVWANCMSLSVFHSFVLFNNDRFGFIETYVEARATKRISTLYINLAHSFFQHSSGSLLFLVRSHIRIDIWTWCTLLFSFSLGYCCRTAATSPLLLLLLLLLSLLLHRPPPPLPSHAQRSECILILLKESSDSHCLSIKLTTINIERKNRGIPLEFDRVLQKKNPFLISFYEIVNKFTKKNTNETIST